jgi:hypothetical protein
VREEWQEYFERYEQAKRNEARCKGRTDWDRIEQGYVDHGIEQIGEPMTPTRLLDVSDLDDIFAGRPLADAPRSRVKKIWKTGATAELDEQARNAAEAEGLPLAALVRKSVREYLDHHHSDARLQTA